MPELSIIRFVLSVLVHAGAVILIFSMYRIPIRKNHMQVAVLSMIMGIVNYAIRYGLDSKLYFPATASAFLIGLMVLRRYPFFYALLMTGIGYFAVGLAEELITFGILSSFGVTLNELLQSPTLLIVSHVCVLMPLLAISYVLRSKEWGFQLIYSRFHGKKWILKGHNFLWATSLVAGMSVLQVTSTRIDVFSFGWFFLILLVLSFSAAVFYTWMENRRVQRDLERMMRSGLESIRKY